MRRAGGCGLVDEGRTLMSLVGTGRLVDEIVDESRERKVVDKQGPCRGGGRLKKDRLELRGKPAGAGAKKGTGDQWGRIETRDEASGRR